MGWADCGIARELQPRLKSRPPGMVLIGPRRAKSQFGIKGVCTPMHFRMMERKVKATGSPKRGVRIRFRSRLRFCDETLA